jgi:hypothetical protein
VGAEGVPCEDDQLRSTRGPPSTRSPG